MDYICTTCCKEKEDDEALLPAFQRYISARIEFVCSESRRLDKPMIILSAKYGFIDSDFEIPWYDKRLEPVDVEGIVPLLVEQLRRKEVSRIIFYGRLPETPGWKPYYDALEKTCHQLSIPVDYHWVDL